MFKHSLSIVAGWFLTGLVSAQTITLLPPTPGGPANARATELALTAARLGSTSQLQEALFQEYTNGAWVDFSRSVYLRYFTATLPGLIRTDLKNGAAWTASIANRLRYTTAGQVLTDTTDQYLTAPYGPIAAVVNTFDTPSQVRWEWHLSRLPGSAASLPFDSVSRNTHTYNAAGQRTQVLNQLYQARMYMAVSRELFAYNAQALLAVEETQTSTTNGTTWVPSQRTTYTYNAAGKVQQLVTEVATPATGVYANSTRDTYQYDAQGRPSVVTNDKWLNSAWIVDGQGLFAYNSAGDLVSLTNQHWTGSAFVNVSRVLFTYQQVTSSRGAAPRRSLVVVPNPSGPGARAQLLLETGAPVPSGAVYDQLGRQVAQLTSTPAQAARGFLSLPANLPAGLYVVHLRAGNQQWQARWQQL